MYSQRLTPAKLPISENRKIRNTWVEEYYKYTVEDWQKILWSDETCISDGRHRRRWVMSKVSRIFILKNNILNLSMKFIAGEEQE